MILDGSQVSSTSTSPFMSFTNSSVDTAGNILTLARSTATTPTRLTLAEPLLSATNSTFNHTSLGFGAACCNAFSIRQGAELTSTTLSAMIQLIDSTVTGADSQSGGNFFGVTDILAAAPTELVAPSKVSLAGPLLQAKNSTITSLFDTISVTRSTLTSTTASPLITLSGSTLQAGGAVDPFTGSASSGQILGMFASGASAATVSLAGPLLTASASTISGSEIVQIINLAKGATFSSTTTQPLVQLDGSTLTMSKAQFVNTGFTAISAASCPSTGCTGVAPDGTFATMNLKGPLLSALNGASVNTSASLVIVSGGGQISVTGSTDPLISLTGGTHAIDSVGVPGFTSAVFELRGRSTATTTEIADGVSVTLGTDEPIKHGGGLFEASGATVTSQKALRMDTALLEASAPLIHLKSNSSLTTNVDALDLIQKTKLTSVGAILKLDASTLTVTTGAAAAVRGGSFLKVTGDLLQLNNGARLNLLNGPVLSVSGSSVVNVSGAFVNFGGSGGNLISVTNTLCSGSCTSIGGVNVFLTGGASSSNVSITNPIKNSGLGSISLSNPLTTAVISVSGSTSKVTISGN